MLSTYSVRKFAKHLAPKALIFLYHRVVETPSDPQLLCVTPAHFAEHLEVLQRNYHLLSLRGLRRRLPLNIWLPRSVVITFDDGYADNFQQARTLLEAKGIPATVFVTSGMVDTQKEFWWDELEHIFLFNGLLPAHLEITINKKKYMWDLDTTPPISVTEHWNVLSKSMPTDRQRVYIDLMKMLHSLLDNDARESVLSELAAWAGIDRIHGRKGYFSVTRDELRSLPKDGLIEVGAHTMNHPSLSALPLSSQNLEITQSKVALEKILEQPVHSFAYPFGGCRDYTVETTRMVRDAGFDSACSNFPGLVTALTDPFQLPRFIVRDWDGDTFANRLREWFGD